MVKHHLVYCGMEHVEPTLGKPHFNENGIVEKYTFLCNSLPLSSHSLEHMTCLSSTMRGTLSLGSQVPPQLFVAYCTKKLGRSLGTRLVNPDRDISLTHTLNPNTATFKQWAERNKHKIIRK